MFKLKLSFFAGVFFFATFGHSFAGIIQQLRGSVQVRSHQTNQTSEAHLGKKVFVGDIVITSSDGRAKILMKDRNEVNIGFGTALRIETYDYSSDSEVKKVELNLIYGNVRSKVEQKYDGDKSQFRVKTLTAVAGVRGTDFTVSFDNQVSRVFTLDGAVEFGRLGPNDLIVEPVTVEKGMTSQNKIGEAPIKPVPLDEKQILEVEEVTSVEPQVVAQPAVVESPVSPEPIPSNQWSHFELAFSRLVQKESTDSPFFGYSPKIFSRFFPEWFYLSPRFDLHFNKSASNKINPIYNLGLQLRFKLSEKFEFTVEGTQSSTSEDGVSKSFTNYGLGVRYRLKGLDASWLSFIDDVFIGYRQLGTPDSSELFLLGVSFDFI